jgi:hypothetical protein
MSECMRSVMQRRNAVVGAREGGAAVGVKCVDGRCQVS